MLHHLRVGCRSLLRRPSFALTTIVVFALALAGTSAIISIVRSTLLSPLPFGDPDHLVQVETLKGGERGKISFREIDDLRERMQSFDAAGAYVPGAEYSIAGAAGPEKPPAILVTSNLFDVLGVPLLHGAAWPAGYDRERQFGLILSHRVWQRQFGGDPAIVGRTIPVDASPFFTPSYTVHGVLPPAVDFPGATDLYRSFFVNPAFPNVVDRGVRNAIGIARLRPGTSAAQAQAEADGIAARLHSEFPATNEGVRFIVRPLRDAYVGDLRPYLALLVAGVALLLAAAVANVTNLFVSYAMSREHEIAVKRALGASRRAIIQPFALEGAIVAGVGALLGVLLGRLLVSALATTIRLDLPTWMAPRVDLIVLVLTVVLALACGATAGALAAAGFSGRSSGGALQAGGRGRVGSRRQYVVHRVLVAAELALAVVLLVGAAMMVRTFVALQGADVGFHTERLLTFRLPLPWTYPVPQRLTFFDEVLRQIQALPGVTSAALSSNLALAQVAQGTRTTLIAEGQSATDVAANPLANFQQVSAGLFQTMGVPVNRGRAIAEGDDERRQRVAVVSERVAARLWPGEDPIGRMLRSPDRQHWLSVVGIAGDVRHERASSSPGFDVYLSIRQFTSNWQHLVVRTTIEPMSLVEPIQRIVGRLDANQAVYDFKTMQQRIGDTEWIRRVAAAILAAGASVALLLCGIGVYGVVAYLVGQRTREIGVRMALGATQNVVRRGVVREGMLMALPGVVCGLAVTALGVRLLTGLIYGIDTYDAVSFTAVPLLLLAIVTLASWMPARRATRISPTEALRAE